MGWVEKYQSNRKRCQNDSTMHTESMYGRYISREQINGLCKTFNFYVKFPISRWSDIKRAEVDTKEGRRIFGDLKQEFIEKYWTNDNSSFEAAAAAVDPHSPIF